MTTWSGPPVRLTPLAAVPLDEGVEFRSGELELAVKRVLMAAQHAAGHRFDALRREMQKNTAFFPIAYLSSAKIGMHADDRGRRRQCCGEMAS